MVFSNPAGYALKALAALPQDGSLVRAKDLATQVGLPAPYLAKILYELSSKGLLHAVRGRGGGVRLALPAHRITLQAVVEALGVRETTPGCLMGLEPCGAGDPCALRLAWEGLMAQRDQALTGMTVRDLQVRHGFLARESREATEHSNQTW